MNFQDKKPGEKNQTDEKLKHLLRTSLSSEMNNPPRPDEIAIRAYVNGNATADQKNIVRDAMMFSESFAEEMLARLEAGQDLEDPELPAKMAKVKVPLEKLMSRSDSFESADNAARNGNTIRLWDKIREFRWQPTMVYGMAVVLLALIIVPRLGNGPGQGTEVATIYLNEYLVTRGAVAPKPYESIRIEAGLEFVDLVVESGFDPTRDISFETTLKMEVDDEPPLLLFDGKTRKYEVTDSGLAYPVLRVEADLLVPGRYVLSFIPVLAGGDPREDLSIEGRFEIGE